MISNETEKMIQGEEKSLNPKGAPFTRCLASQKPPSGLTVTPGAVVGTVSSQQEGRGFDSRVGSSLWGGCTLSPRKTCTLVFAVSVTAPTAGTGSTPSLHRPAPLDPECRVSSDRQIVGIFVNVREPGDTQASGGIDQTPSSLTLCRCVPLTLLWTNQRPPKVVLKVIMFWLFLVMVDAARI